MVPSGYLILEDLKRLTRKWSGRAEPSDLDPTRAEVVSIDTPRAAG